MAFSIKTRTRLPEQREVLSALSVLLQLLPATVSGTHRNEANFPSPPASRQQRQSRIKIREILRIARAPSLHPQASAVLSSAQCRAAQQLFFLTILEYFSRSRRQKKFSHGPMMVAAVAPHAASGLSCQSAPPPQPRLRCTLGRGLGARGQKPPARLGFAADADDDARHKS